jgi:NAD(P)H-dependent FMN reductase
MNTPHILVFYGSRRIGAAAPMVGAWLEEKLKSETRATFSFVDVAKLNLPLYDLEWPLAPLGPFPSPDHETWAREAGKADAFIVITNEYNHAAAPVVKNAIDLLKAQWEKKPIAIMSYGGVLGGGRAAEHLRHVFAELYAMTIREQLYVPHVYAGADKNGKLKDEAVVGDLEKFMDLLLWWTHALKTAREQK